MSKDEKKELRELYKRFDRLAVLCHEAGLYKLEDEFENAVSIEDLSEEAVAFMKKSD